MDQSEGHGAGQMLDKWLFVHEWCLGKESDFLTLSQVARRMELPSSEMGVAEGGAGIGENQEHRSGM